MNACERFIEKHSDELNMEVISCCKYITQKFIESHSEGPQKWNWDMYLLSRNPVVTIDFIEKHSNGRGINLSWSGRGFSHNPNITLDFIKTHFYWGDFDWKLLSTNPIITLDFAEENPFLIDTYMYSMNPNVNADFIEKHPNWNWNLSELMKNPGIDINFLEKNFSKYPFFYFFNFSKIIEKENAKVTFLLGEKDGKSFLYNFSNNILFDPNLNKLIFSYL